MDNNEVIAYLRSNPELLGQAAEDEAFLKEFEKVAPEALIKNRDSIVDQLQTQRAKVAAFESQVAPVIQAPAPIESKPASRKSDDLEGSPAMKRVMELEAKLAAADERAALSSKKDALNAALSGLPFKDGAMAMAQRVIDLDMFEPDGFGGFRHRANSMPLSEYVQSEWANTEGKVLLDASKNGGGGQAASRRPTSPLSKRFSDMNATEKAQYHKENGPAAYTELQSRG